jgi:hypothetical protein
MEYMTMFRALRDAAILFIGSTAIIGMGAIAFGGLVWLYLWIGKHLVRYIYKVGAEFKECFAPEVIGKKVKA